MFTPALLQSQPMYQDKRNMKKLIIGIRPANNSHLSGILAEFMKIFCEKKCVRFNFPHDLRKILPVLLSF